MTICENVTLTSWAAVIDTVHVSVVLDLHAPPQADTKLLSDGVAVSTTLVPPWKSALHVVPHEIPRGALVTLPAPLPETLTRSLNTGVKVAVTACASVIETVQVSPVVD
jgi:hypothetical protein